MEPLTVPLDPQSDLPLYRQLYRHIQREIISGDIGSGEKLPSVRRLAAHLGCSRNTVQSAYDQLTAEGYTEARPKSGYLVCRIDGLVLPGLSRETDDTPEEPRAAWRYDFSHHGVDPEGFPYTAWRRLFREVLSGSDPSLLRAGHPQGEPALRAAVAGYLYQSRGVRCSPDQVIVSAGTEFLMQLLILLLPGCLFALEDPGYERLGMIFRSCRASHAAVPVDGEGMVPEALEKSGANAACITPSHQFPTGIIMPASRRARLLGWAADAPERYLIEDDYDSEFRYGGRPIPSLQGMDSGGRVVYVGSFSKSLAPSLRVSYMVLPPYLLALYRRRLGFHQCPVPVFVQRVLTRAIREGLFERHLNVMRSLYRKKRELLIRALRDRFPEASVGGAAAGLHVVLTLPGTQSEEVLVSAAREKGLLVYGLSQFCLAAQPPDASPSVLLGFASIPADEVEDAVAALRDAWADI